MKALDSFKR